MTSNQIVRGIVALAVCCIPAIVSAQQPSVVPVIAGQVLAADSDTPLRRARVSMAAGSSRPDPVMTDDNGRFAIEVPGSGITPFTLTIAKGGFVTATTSVLGKDVQAPLLVRLPRGAAISGIVVDSSGAPVASMSVSASRIEDGARATGAPTQYSARTDDLGEYRLAGLSRGRYEVWAGVAFQGVQISGVSPERIASVLKELPGVIKTAVTVETAEEVGGVHLTAPAENAVEFMLRTTPPPPQGIDPAPRPPAQVLPTRGRATIRGLVLTAARRPVQGATVSVSGTGNSQTRTDRDGAFSLLLAPGQYTLQTTTNGQMTWYFGQNAVGQTGRPINLAADQIAQGIEIVLPPARAISGVVLDEHGEPLQDARVQAMQARYASGRLVAVPVGAARLTDDRGRYRLWGLHPGAYLVAASVEGLVPAGRGQAAYAKTYFPDTPLSSAALPVDVREDATANLAFAPVRLTEVRGLARDGDAGLVSGTARLFEDRQSGAVVTEPRVAELGTDGTFVFRNVPPGNYIVQVRGDGPGRTGLFGAAELLVGTEPTRLTMRTSYGTNIEGNIRFEGDMDQTRTGSFGIGTVPLDDRARESTSRLLIAGSEFSTINGLFGLTSLSLQYAPADDWYLKSWTINGTDVADTGYDFGAQPRTIEGSEIVLSRNGASISGRLSERNGTVDDYFVVVFPASREMRVPESRRAKISRSTLDGTFRVGGLPAGDYFVAAVSQLQGTRDGGEWQNPDVLRQLEARGERLTLSEGQSRTITLRLIER
jgi:hypothetical protein